MAPLQCHPAQGLPRTEWIKLAPVNPPRNPWPALTASCWDRNLLSLLQGFRIWLAAWKAATPRADPTCPGVAPEPWSPMELLISVSGRKFPSIELSPERKGLPPLKNCGAASEIKLFPNIRDFFFTSFNSEQLGWCGQSEVKTDETKSHWDPHDDSFLLSTHPVRPRPVSTAVVRVGLTPPSQVSLFIHSCPLTDIYQRLKDL